MNLTVLKFSVPESIPRSFDVSTPEKSREAVRLIIEELREIGRFPITLPEIVNHENGSFTVDISVNDWAGMNLADLLDEQWRKQARGYLSALEQIMQTTDESFWLVDTVRDKNLSDRVWEKVAQWYRAQPNYVVVTSPEGDFIKRSYCADDILVLALRHFGSTDAGGKKDFVYEHRKYEFSEGSVELTPKAC